MGKMEPITIHPEYLSNDILEDTFVNTFKLFCRVQMWMGSCRVHLKDRFVSSPSRWQKVYTTFVMLVCFALSIFVVVAFFKNFQNNNILYYLMVTASWVHVFICFSNMVHVRFFNGNANAEFFLGMQRVDRLMKIERNVYINGIPRRLNAITVIVVLTCIALIFICGSYRSLDTLAFLGIAFAQSTFILELAFCSNLVIFYGLRIGVVNGILQNHLKKYKGNPIPMNNFKFPTKKIIRNLAALTHEFTTSETDIFLKEIFESFREFHNIYKFQVLLFFTRIILMSIISFEIILIGLQNGVLGAEDISVVCVFIFLDILIITSLCIRFEVFFYQVRQTKKLSISIMSVYQEGHLREKAKRMYKMAEDTPPRFSVYDMWVVDARVLLQLFMLMTTIIVTLLQFALL